MNLHFSSAAVIGTGLIGGSLALALRNKGVVDKVVGVGRGAENLEDALRLGIIDSYTHDPEEAVKNAELVVFATPVQAIAPIVSRIKNSLAPGALLTDVASTKSRVTQEIESLIPDTLDFVPAHPVAGKERSGARESEAGLFQNRWTIITPGKRTRPEAIEKIRTLWTIVGARVELMDPELHDKIMAAISHLPHIIAYSLVETISQIEEQDPILRFTAGGFHDYIRIAGSSPEMWRDICLENQGPINEMIGLYMNQLQKLGTMIDNRDAQGLFNLFSKSRDIKEDLEK